jgi:hypothetical protein
VNGVCLGMAAPVAAARATTGPGPISSWPARGRSPCRTTPRFLNREEEERSKMTEYKEEGKLDLKILSFLFFIGLCLAGSI